MARSNDPYFSDDYAEKGPSPRETAAREFAEALKAYNFLVGDVGRSEDKRCWRFAMDLPNAEAYVEVFSVAYFRITWKFLRGIPDHRTFTTAVYAEAFCQAAFVQGNWDLANSIPTFVAKRPTKFPQTELPWGEDQ